MRAPHFPDPEIHPRALISIGAQALNRSSIGEGAWLADQGVDHYLELLAAHREILG